MVCEMFGKKNNPSQGKKGNKKYVHVHVDGNIFLKHL